MQRNENGPGQVKNAPLFDGFGVTNDESKTSRMRKQHYCIHIYFIIAWYFVLLNLTFWFYRNVINTLFSSDLWLMVPGQSLQIVKWISEIKMPTLMEIIKVGKSNWAEILSIIPLNIMGTI